jgi:hypothetical protein
VTGLKRSTSPTCRHAWALSAALTSAWASAVLPAIGFSTRQWTRSLDVQVHEPDEAHVLAAHLVEDASVVAAEGPHPDDGGSQRRSRSGVQPYEPSLIAVRTTSAALP